MGKGFAQIIYCSVQFLCFAPLRSEAQSLNVMKPDAFWSVFIEGRMEINYTSVTTIYCAYKLGNLYLFDFLSSIWCVILYCVCLCHGRRTHTQSSRCNLLRSLKSLCLRCWIFQNITNCLDDSSVREMATLENKRVKRYGIANKKKILTAEKNYFPATYKELLVYSLFKGYSHKALHLACFLIY